MTFLHMRFTFLLRIWAIFLVAARRVFSRRWLALATVAGLVAAVALIVSIPLYADAIYYRVLSQEISDQVAAQVGRHPPFAFLFRYAGSGAEPVDWEELSPIDAYLAGRAGADLGLPQTLSVRHFRTEKFGLFAAELAPYADRNRPLTWAAFSFTGDIEDHITITEGRYPAPVRSGSDSALEVLVGESFAAELGLQIGETYVALAPLTVSGAERRPAFSVRIAGTWKARDPEEDYWFYGATAFDSLMMVPQETFVARLSPYLRDEVSTALWYLVMDGTEVHASDTMPLLRRIAAVQQRTAGLLPNIELAVSPVDAFWRYQRAANLLTILLYAFSLPTIGLVLAFIALTASLAVEGQRNEIATMRSRGAATFQVVGIAALEGMLLSALGLLIGLPASEGVARAISGVRSFLDFGTPADLRVGMTLVTVRFGVAAVGLALAAQLLPTLDAARHTIVSYKKEQARVLRPAWWQRAWLDLLLLIPAAYGFYLLRRQGSIATSLPGGLPADPFQNPLLFLVPTLSIVALTLFILRLLPLLTAGIGWVVARTGNVGLLVATRHLSRSPAFYVVPLLLLVLTLSLSVYMASLAQTLDRHMYDRAYYEVGADLALEERGEGTGDGSTSYFGSSPAGDSRAADEASEPLWRFLPVAEHLKVPGVEAAARIGRYPAETQMEGGLQVGTFIGVDRTDFPQVAFWRRDHAAAGLGTLMNALALARDGVLIPASFMAQHALSVGDTIRVAVNTFGQRNEIDVRIAGSFDLFPTWYPELGQPLFVGNLDYLYEQTGGQFPYDVWLRTAPGQDAREIVEEVRSLGLTVWRWEASQYRLAREQQRPERQGLFGVLSIGFVAAAFLTVFGFLLYAFFSFRRRYVELGVLRAIGLSAGQMTSFLAWELGLLLATGLVAGTGLGVFSSRLFIPYLQTGTDVTAQTPPFVVEIAWPAVFRIYGLFGLLFAVALIGLATVLLRLKVFQAIKLGETL